MATFQQSLALRLALYLVSPALTLVFGWSGSSIALASVLSLSAIALHVYYHKIYIPLPVYLVRLAAFTGISLIWAAMLQGPALAPGYVPAIESGAEIPMAGKVSSSFLSSQPIVTMSIVLPCANEGKYAWQTAQSLAELTPESVLHEVIVVDDGSTPPLSTQFPPEIVKTAKVKFLRHESHTGLINAKSAGANAATGDIVVFLDCHVKPAPKWEEEIIEKIRSNYRRVVVPSITGLDPDTWEEVRGNGGMAKCYLTWDADFKWFDSDDNNVAVMSGGLLAMSRQWWIETGGYDTSMRGWGGENIDQSLRIWLCHGEIVQGTTSFVGHMWRTKDKPETRARYSVPAGSVRVNRYRGASVWMGAWREKLETFAMFENFKNDRPDVSNIQSVKDRLKCKDFSYFIDRFHKVYHWGGLLPSSVFHIRDAVSGMCIQRKGEEDLIITQCSDDNAGQLWHRSNRDGDKCCSGYRNWNSDQCITGQWVGGKARTSVCNIGGVVQDQYIKLNPENGQLELTKRRGSCLGGKMVERQRAELASCSDSAGFRLKFKKVPIDAALASPVDGGETAELIRFEDAEKVGVCLAALGGSGNVMGRLEVHDCDPSSSLQIFTLRRIAKLGETRVEAIGLDGSGTNLCLDAGGTKEMGLYPCYNDSQNLNQAVDILADGTGISLRFKDTKCVGISKAQRSDGTLGNKLTLQGCVVTAGNVKRGQWFKKIYHNPQDKSIFSLENRDGNCLTANGAQDIVIARGPCDRHLFKQDPADAKKRLLHVASSMCVDGNDGISPTLYKCYEGDNTNQQFDLETGYVKLERTGTCIDFEPSQTSPANVVPCSETLTVFKWEEYHSFEPIETKLYHQQKASASHDGST